VASSPAADAVVIRIAQAFISLSTSDGCTHRLRRTINKIIL
jgi:hypothetical protein